MLKRKLWKVLCLALCILFAFSSVAFAAQTVIVAKDAKGFLAEKQINAWIAKGFLTIGADGSFRPFSGMTVADLAGIVNKAFGFTAKDTTNYKDVKARDIYYNAMLIAKKSGISCEQCRWDNTAKGIHHKAAICSYPAAALEN